jgi:valyl-tRNA synthetase
MVILGGGEIEAAVRPRATHDEAAELERDRLERDLEEAEGWLAATRERLANESFVSRAPASVVEGARAREAELADQVARLRDRTGR